MREKNNLNHCLRNLLLMNRNLGKLFYIKTVYQNSILKIQILLLKIHKLNLTNNLRVINNN